jgi:hypothetical protein
MSSCGVVPCMRGSCTACSCSGRAPRSHAPVAYIRCGGVWVPNKALGLYVSTCAHVDHPCSELALTLERFARPAARRGTHSSNPRAHECIHAFNARHCAARVHETARRMQWPGAYMPGACGLARHCAAYGLWRACPLRMPGTEIRVSTRSRHEPPPRPPLCGIYVCAPWTRVQDVYPPKGAPLRDDRTLPTEDVCTTDLLGGFRLLLLLLCSFRPSILLVLGSAACALPSRSLRVPHTWASGSRLMVSAGSAWYSGCSG